MQFEIFDELRSLKKQYGSFVSGSFLQVMEFIEKIKNKKELRILKKDETLTIEPCGAATKKCAIKPDGTVIPCELLWNMDAGNCLKTDLSDIWKTNETMQAFRKNLCLTRADIGECMDCEYRYICYTGHRCNPYYLDGSIQNKKLFCLKRNI